MDNASYATLTRQSGLRDEMQVIANNLANVSTGGFRREGVVFSEFVARHETADTSLSMARAHGRIIDRQEGPLRQTSGVLDLALQGEGFFMLQTENGRQLTRAGNFGLNAAGEIVASDGARLLDGGGAPIQVPAGAEEIRIASDGTLSVNGTAIADVGVFLPNNPDDLVRAAGVRFASEAGAEPVAEPRVAQGFLEGSNVSPIEEIARMIVVQRAYEAGKNLVSSEHERIRDVVKTLGK